jgi:hypothetical protein
MNARPAPLGRRDTLKTPIRRAFTRPDAAEAAPGLPGSDQEAENFKSLIAAKSLTSPPTRLVA